MLTDVSEVLTASFIRVVSDKKLFNVTVTVLISFCVVSPVGYLPVDAAH
jgi:hypothetical protein